MNSPYLLELIIYDLDGTLIDSGEDIARATNYALVKLGLPPVKPDRIFAAMGMGVARLVESLLPPDHQDYYHEVVQLFRERYHEHLLDNTKVKDGALGVLEYFRKKGKQQALVTNKSKAFTDPILEGLKLKNYFAVVLGGDSRPLKKPDPSPLLHVMEELGCRDKRRTAMIGDSPIDIAAGQAAGVITVALTDGYGKREDILKAGADYVLTNIREMKEIFE